MTLRILIIKNFKNIWIVWNFSDYLNREKKMNAEINQNLALYIETKGRNTIPYINSGNIITIHGKNGVGKSMAGMLLEIASGNYIFENENRFQKLANVIESCEIQYKEGDDLLYKVILKPHLWSFDKNLNRVKPLTLGNFYKGVQGKEKEINFKEFSKDVNVRTIRGNESLQQQIFFSLKIYLLLKLTKNWKNWRRKLNI